MESSRHVDGPFIDHHAATVSSVCKQSDYVAYLIFVVLLRGGFPYRCFRGRAERWRIQDHILFNNKECALLA